MRLNTIYPTIQGEGTMTGTPIILVRFQGCNLSCPFCDTPEALDPDGGYSLTVPETTSEIQRLTTGHNWVLITGGEPMLQSPSVHQLTRALHNRGYRVALESNGTYPIPPDLFDWVCISPKTHKVLKTWSQANELKFIVSGPPSIPDARIIPPGATICLQPESLDPHNTELCTKTVQERGWQLSLQTHKFVNLP